MPTELKSAIDPSIPITYLPNVLQPGTFSKKPLHQALDAIKSGVYKDMIQSLRRTYLQNQGNYKTEKLNLPAYCFNGTFEDKVTNSNFQESSNLFNVDIDGLSGDIEDHKLKAVTSIPSLVYCCVSPSGAGIKAGLRVDSGAIKNDADFKKVFTAAEYLFAAIGYKIDPACKDIKRACFVSDDSEIYINYAAAVFYFEEYLPAELEKPTQIRTGIGESQPQAQALTTSGSYSVEKECIGIVTGMLNNAKIGERHGARLSASRLAGGYAAGGLVDEQLIWDSLVKASDQIAVGGTTTDTEYNTLVDAFNHGQKTPISIEDFRKEHGYNIALFTNAVEGQPLELTKNGRGQIRATLDNTHKALSTPQFSGYSIGYDTFKDQIMYNHQDTASLWQPFDDETYTALRIQLPKLGFEEIPAPLMRDAVHFTAKQHRFDSAQEWLSGLIWDGVPRVESFNPTYFATADSPYTRATGLYLWTAATGRILDPGCQCDMVPVYQSLQGDGKSSAVAALAPKDMSTEISFLDDEDKSSRKLRGVMVAEISELRGLHTKDLESIKAFITRRYDRWVPKYKEFAIEAPRRSIFIGTTNNKEFLGDPTGQRRWLPMTSGKVDKAGIERDKDQLWAEAAVIYKERGICWQDAERLALDEHEDYIAEDLWSGPIQAYLERVAKQGGVAFPLNTASILLGALEIEPRNQRKADEMRAAAVLRILGYQSERKMIAGKRRIAWVLP